MHLLSQVAQPQGQSIARNPFAQASVIITSCSACSSLVSSGDVQCPGCGLTLIREAMPARPTQKRGRLFWLAVLAGPVLLELVLAAQLGAVQIRQPQLAAQQPATMMAAAHR